MNLPKIAGRFETPKPWQLAIGAAAVVVAVVLGPAVKEMVVTKKKQQTAQISRAGQAGEPWHPVSFPVPTKPSPPPPPPNLQVLTPLPRRRPLWPRRR